MNNETQRGWRERFDEKWPELCHDKYECSCGNADIPAIKDFIDELLAAQETAFKERVEKALEDMSCITCRQEILTRIEGLGNSQEV